MAVATRPEVNAHERACELTTAQVAAALQGLLGQKLAAFIAGVSDVKAVGKWSSGARTPHPDSETRLRAALQVADLLLERTAPGAVRAWFVGMNPYLEDRAPAELLAEGNATPVLQAARAYMAHAL